MTDKEKARAYDEALKCAKMYYKENKNYNSEFLPIIFPELKKDEDERIRKAILGLTYIDGIEPILTKCSITAGDIRTYLEKQKEKEKYDRMMPVYDNLDSFESALAKAWKAYNDSGARTVDGCEDDYVECAHAKGFREGYLFGIEKQKEQNPAELDDYKDKINVPYCSSEPEWSEEDEKFAYFVNQFLEYYENADPTAVSCKKWFNNRLKSIKPQSKAEWSKEDDQYLLVCKNALSKYERSDGWDAYIISTWLEKRLKSLRPSWKPSEEQMKALKNSAYGTYQNGDGPVLRGLYEQLEKLM